LLLSFCFFSFKKQQQNEILKNFELDGLVRVHACALLLFF